ncbi:MAG: glycosyltransferase family protein [Candidatus Nanoarchaeia archaeon]|jgi:uncharacterized protein (TIGR00661 family)
MVIKTLFSVYGYGLGHATRCEAIMKELKGATRVVASENAYDYFNNKGYNPLRINSFKIGNIMKSFSWAQTIFENIDFPFNMLADYNQVKRLSNEFKPDAIVSDTEPVSMLYAHSAGIKNYFLSNLVPIIHEYARAPVNMKNPKLDGQEAVIRMLMDMVVKRSELILSPTINRYESVSKVKYTDLIVRQQPSELPSAEEIREQNKLPKDYILVSFGGASITSEYFKTIIPVLKELTKEQFVISTNNAVKRYTKINNLRLYPFIDDYLSMLKGCKAVICLAGHSTLSESLVYGKPSFVIPIQEHIEQLTNALVIDNKKLGKSFFYNNEIKAKRLKESLKEFLNNVNEYESRIKKANYKGNGHKEMAFLMEKALK